MGPAVVAVVPLGGAIGVRHYCYPCRHVWLQTCLSHYLLVHLWRATGSAVWCWGGGRLFPVMVLGGEGSAAIYPHWNGRRVSESAHSPRHSSQSGVGLSALGPRGSSGGAGGSRTRWTPVTAKTSCVPKKACTPSRALGAGRGGRGTVAAP